MPGPRHVPEPVYYEPPPEPPPEAPESDLFDIGKYLNGLRRRWPLILICCLLAGTFALIRYSLTPKEYRSTTIIQIERKRLSLLAAGQAGWLEDWWNMEYYPTQYRLLRSRGMAERVLLNLRLHEDPAFTGRSPSLIPQGEEDVQTNVDDAAELARLAGRLQGRLTVNPIKETQLVELTYRSSSPQLAARIANGYAEVFIQWGIKTRNTTVTRATDTLGSLVGSLRQEIENRQLQLNSFTHDLDNTLDPAGEALIERRRTLEEKWNIVVSEKISREAAYKQLASAPDQLIANTASGGEIKVLEGELFELENEYSKKLETYEPKWPEMTALRGEIEKKRTDLDRRISVTVKQIRDAAYNDYQQALREENKIAEEVAKVADEARGQNSSALEYNNLLTLIDMRKELLNDLLRRQSQTEVASRVDGAQESNVRVVDTAVVPAGPFRPSLRDNLFQALILGLLMGVGGVVLLEYFDRTIKTPEELENLLGLPNLAVIPDIDEAQRGYGKRYGSRTYGYGYGYGYGSQEGDKSKLGRKTGDEPAQKIELLPHRNSRLAICEAYRSLRTALLLSSAKALKLVAMTSAEPGEGKTATTANLGVVLAQLNRRVLIIDCDLRRPRMHKVFEVSNRFGLVNVLTSQTDFERVLQRTEVGNLWICPAGPNPPNPSELLSSERMAEILTAAKQHFDIVLIDTPPVLPVADAVILGSQVDGVVLCVRSGVIQRDDARTCRERLTYKEIRILGTVLNRYRSPTGRYDKRDKYYGAYEELPEAPEATQSSAAQSSAAQSSAAQSSAAQSSAAQSSAA